MFLLPRHPCAIGHRFTSTTVIIRGAPAVTESILLIKFRLPGHSDSDVVCYVYRLKTAEMHRSAYKADLRYLKGDHSHGSVVLLQFLRHRLDAGCSHPLECVLNSGDYGFCVQQNYMYFVTIKSAIALCCTS
ncbi:hypothetical protein Tco_1067128 [Tanacetum coccineum]|uniref:Uncharacterized protein n=1 Tax=Tanacetum coccineum TaxID=301880 RepID=A0ABQ5HC09_9ASTR